MKFDYIYKPGSCEIIPGIPYHLQSKLFAWISKSIYYSLFDFYGTRYVRCKSDEYNSLKMFYEIR